MRAFWTFVLTGIYMVTGHDFERTRSQRGRSHAGLAKVYVLLLVFVPVGHERYIIVSGKGVGRSAKEEGLGKGRQP